MCIHNIGDLVAAESKYYHHCQIRFHMNRVPAENTENKIKGHPKGSVDNMKRDASQHIFDYLDEKDDHQL